MKPVKAIFLIFTGLVLLTAFHAVGATVFTNLVYFDTTNGNWFLVGTPFESDANLVQANDGNFYGVTWGGGIDSSNPFGGDGTIFRLTPSGVYTLLVEFNITNGSKPFGGLIQGMDGSLYGTTADGTNYGGTVYRVTTNGAVTVLWTFNGTNGMAPQAGLVQDKSGALYGTTYYGGSGYVGRPGYPFLFAGGDGTVFKIDTNGNFSSLVSFNGTNGDHPQAALTLGCDGNFYGTTSVGGATFINEETNGYGTIFKMTPTGALTTLFSFNGNNGGYPESALLQADDGNLYGTTYSGGINDAGTVFKITTNGDFASLVSFDGGNDALGQAALVQGSDGNFYGTTSTGSSDGSIFQMTPAGFLTNIKTFNALNGSYPARLTLGTDGDFYGITQDNGSPGFGINVGASGTIFRLSFPQQPIIHPSVETNGTIFLQWNSVSGQKYQLQYSTNLTSAAWHNLGGTNTATNGVMSAFDAETNLQRFYRLFILP